MIPNDFVLKEKKEELISTISNFQELILAISYYLIFR